MPRKCKYHDICGLNADGDPEGLCVLHSNNSYKAHGFAKMFEQHRKSKGDKFAYFIFPEKIEFYNIEFTEGADFLRTTFKKGAHFSFAKFKKKTFFSVATFNEEADFHGATFSEEAYFDDVRFTKGANFWGTNFEKGDVIFSYSNLFGRSTFIGRKYKEKTIPIFKDVLVDFRNVVINPPNVAIFRDADLSRCLFQGTRLDKIEFTNVKWAKISGKLGYSRTGVYDEKVLLDNIKNKKKTKNKDKDDLDWEHIERVYRDLKINHKESGDHERAGDFHYGEKEMRRRNPDTPRAHRFFLNLYRIISGYGERYLRPLFWAAVLLVLCTFGYLLLGISKDEIPLKLANPLDWIRTALYSLQVMTFIRPTYLEHTTLASTGLKAFQSIFGPVVIGLFALALRQRLKR